MNVQKILKEFKHNPLEELICVIKQQNTDKSFTSIQKNIPEIHLLRIQYSNYYLSCDRVLNEISIERRFRNGPYYVLKYGEKYTENYRKIANKYNKIKQYTELDFYNFKIHSSMLLDCVARLAKYVIKGKELPKFGSFKVHRKSFVKEGIKYYRNNQKYASYIINKTKWFNNLSNCRNELLVHPKHFDMRFLGMPFGSNKFKLQIIWDTSNKNRTVELSQDDQEISVVELIDHINDFLVFFNEYRINKL